MTHLLTIFALLACPSYALGQNPDDAQGPVVVATVNGHKIYLAEVQRQKSRLTIRDVEDEELQAQALQALIQRELVLQTLERRMGKAIHEIVEAKLASRRQALADRGEVLSTACYEAGITEETLRRSLAWSYAWPAYQAKHLDARRLNRYFREHRAHFDGGRREVAHILWKVANDATEIQRQEMMREARDVAERIRREEITFADAAREFSHGPSGKSGGALGWIQRGGPMTDAFSKVAFELEAGETSAPVVDAFGIHLIQCTQAEAGDRSYAEALEAVHQQALRDLFEALVRRQRKNARVEYVGSIPPRPHWKTETLLPQDATLQAAKGQVDITE